MARTARKFKLFTLISLTLLAALLPLRELKADENQNNYGKINYSWDSTIQKALYNRFENRLKPKSRFEFKTSDNELNESRELARLLEIYTEKLFKYLVIQNEWNLSKKASLKIKFTYHKLQIGTEF